MKYVRYRRGDDVGAGILEGDLIRPVRGSLFESPEPERRTIPLAEARLLAPVLPSKIVAVGLNYRDHAAERDKPLPDEPLLFLKPSTAVIGPGDAILYPAMSRRVDYEGELAFVVGRRACGLTEADRAEDYILGYTCFNDVTARDLQDKDKQFTRAKSFDTFAAIGPCLAVGLDPSRLAVQTFLNGELRQSSDTSNLIFPIPFLLRFISRVMTLLPGDVVTTGTPAGIGPMQPGDTVDVRIEGIGTLTNSVLKSPPRA